MLSLLFNTKKLLDFFNEVVSTNLNLKGLMPGEYRPLTIKEVKILYSLCKK